MFKVVLLGLIGSAVSAPVVASDVTLPASKFPFCLEARTKTLNCERKTVSLGWSCSAGSASQSALPKCLTWDTGEIAVTCTAWTDGSYLYGSQFGDNPARRPDALEPVYACIKQRPVEEIMKQFDFAPGDLPPKFHPAAIRVPG